MNTDLHALDSTKTWSVTIERYKFRLMADGYTQLEGLEFFTLFFYVDNTWKTFCFNFNFKLVLSNLM